MTVVIDKDNNKVGLTMSYRKDKALKCYRYCAAKDKMGQEANLTPTVTCGNWVTRPHKSWIIFFYK